MVAITWTISQMLRSGSLIIVAVLVIFVIVCPAGTVPNHNSKSQSIKGVHSSVTSQSETRHNGTLHRHEKISKTRRHLKDAFKLIEPKVNSIRKKHKLRHNAKRRARKQQLYINSNRANVRRRNYRLPRISSESDFLMSNHRNRKQRKKRNFRNMPTSLNKNGFWIERDKTHPRNELSLAQFNDDEINEKSNLIGLGPGTNANIEITIEVFHKSSSDKHVRLDSPAQRFKSSQRKNHRLTEGKKLQNDFDTAKLQRQTPQLDHKHFKKQTVENNLENTYAVTDTDGKDGRLPPVVVNKPNEHLLLERKNDNPTQNNSKSERKPTNNKSTRMEVKPGKETTEKKVENGITEWSNWTKCSVTCGMGKKDRERKCGKHCRETESVQCWMPPCHATGSWQHKEIEGPKLPLESSSVAKADYLNPKVDNCRKWLKCANKFLLKYLSQLEDLPSCPCKYPVTISIQGDIWDELQKRFFKWHDASDTSERLDVYKPDARYCIRSDLIPGSANLAAQQCCYDDKLRLITRGRNAGTSNLISPQLSPALHHKIDILPWIICKGDWTKYNLVRPPNNMRSCPENPDNDTFLKEVREVHKIHS